MKRLYSACTGHVEQFIHEEAEHPAFAAYRDALYFDYSREKPAPAVETEPSMTNTKFVVVEQDCVDVGIELAKTYGGSQVGVLNMANEWNCGGGFERTSGSQEEYLFRRTSCAVSLWPRRRDGDERWTIGCRLLGREERSFYQLTEAGGILTPSAAVICDSRLKYVDRDTRISNKTQFPDLGMISIAAQDLRPRPYNKGVVFDRNLTKEKFRTALSIGLHAGHKALVLGAIGCGAFKNPPREIAAIFMDLLTTEYRNQFAEVHFAIILSKTNLSIFQQVVHERAPPRNASDLLQECREVAGNSSFASVREQSTQHPPSQSSGECRFNSLKEAGNKEVKAANYRKAIELYTFALSELPCDDADHYKEYAIFGNRALCYIKLGCYEEAQKDAQEAVGRNPSFTKGYYRLAICQKQLGDLAGAWENVARAVGLDPHDAEIRSLEKEIERLERGE